MSATPQNNTENQEIDLSQLSRKIGDFFEGISTKIFKGILLFLKEKKANRWKPSTEVEHHNCSNECFP